MVGGVYGLDGTHWVPPFVTPDPVVSDRTTIEQRRTTIK